MKEDIRNCFIRRAKIEDYESVLKIMNQVQQMHIKWRPDIYRHNDHLIPIDAFRKIVESGTFFVAETDEKIAGIMEVMYKHIETPSHVTRNIVFIDAMAVDETYRGNGIGRKLFEKAKEIKSEKGFDGIELQVNAKNKSAYEMYLKYGFTEKSINMELL